MKRWIASIGALVVVLFLAWYAGIDFFQRGFDQAYFVGIAIFFSILVWTYPGWKENLK